MIFKVYGFRFKVLIILSLRFCFLGFANFWVWVKGRFRV
jgi:hypothetical protein